MKTRSNKTISFSVIQIPFVFLIFFGSCHLSGQINVDRRSFEAVAWFDTLYTNLLSKPENLNQDYINPLLQKTYHGIANDLEKRKMYWEIEDHIWKIDPEDHLVKGLTKNYTEALSQAFQLRDYAMKISQGNPDEMDLQMIRQIYSLDKYSLQLEYIASNYREDNERWRDYKHKFQMSMDELAVHLNNYLTDKDAIYQDLKSDFIKLNKICEVMPLRLPSTPIQPGRFGAYYTNLKYYPDWDKKWRVGSDPDVVIQFPDDIHKFVFWRGTNYIPHWVTEKGFWFNNEFNETWFSEGSAEPMSDKQCRYSHVRVIESNDARVVIHWRYALNDVNYDIAWPDQYTGWGDWSDEYYYIYPDAIGVRKVILHTSYASENDTKSTDEEGHEWQEGIVVYHPFTKPEEYLHIDAVHVANMKGESGEWSWKTAGKPTTPTPDGSNIVMMNMRSDLKPFIISAEGCDLAAYEGAQGGSHFRWRDHWPTTTEPTPGRNASGKQAAHGSFFHVLNIPYYDKAPNRLTKVMLHGLTRSSVEGLVPVARSWLHPPELKMEDQPGHIAYLGYDPGERAYVVNIMGDNKPGEISFQIDANTENPSVNPVFIINHWENQKPQVLMNGSKLEYGRDFTSGIESGLDQSRCVIWLNKELTGLTQIIIH